MLNLASPYTVDYVAIEAETAALPDVTNIVIDVDISMTQKQDSSGNALGAQITFAGDLSTTLVNPTRDSISGDYTWITPSTLELNGEVSSSAGHSLEAGFTANISNANSFELFDDQDETWQVEGPGNGQWLDATLGLSFSLQLAGLPEASVSITGDRTGFDDGTATVTIAYGTRRIELNATVADREATGNLVITNQDGVLLTVEHNANNDTGTIKFNGQSYGTIEELSNGLVKITYSDGTFEIL